MRITKILAAAVLALSVAMVSKSAHAIPISAVWTGTLNYGTEIGQTITMTFNYTSEAVNASSIHDSSSYTEFQTSNNPNFFSSVTMSLSGGLSYSMPVPTSFSQILLGDSADYYRSLYYNFAQNNSGATLYAYLVNTAVAGITSTDPAYTFTHAVNTTDPAEYGIIYYNFSDANGNHYGAAEAYLGGFPNGIVSVALNGSSVPAPGALALLGLGLLGIGALRRRKAA